MNAKISALFICVEAYMHLLLYDLHECTFKENNNIKTQTSETATGSVL